MLRHLVALLLIAATAVKSEKICKSIQITRMQDFALLRNCTVIVGHVHMANVQAPAAVASAEYATSVREITDYLLVYRMQSLDSLEHIFPHLALIRGQALFGAQYALIVFENRNLLSLGLGSLLRIQSGDIRVESNPQLCFVNTINWLYLLGNGTQQHYTVKNNKPSNLCPLCSPIPTMRNNSVLAENAADEEEPIAKHCWSLSSYQRLPTTLGQCGTICDAMGCTTNGACCSRRCLSGCLADNCAVCATLRQDQNCVDTCGSLYYQFNKRECIMEDVCRERKLIPHDGQCLEKCPPYYVRTPGTLGCNLRCSGDFVVHTTKDLAALQNCATIRGSLTIELSDIKSGIISDMERLLLGVTKITGYLKILNSPQLVSLNVLRHLDTINGDQLIDNNYALYVVNNHYLEDIWSVNQTVAIRKGHVYFHLNPRLCHEKILLLQDSLQNRENISITDASPNSNGERVICGGDVRVLHAIVEDSNATAVRIKVEPMSADDKEVLIGYLYHYKEAPVQNVTMYDGRHGCGHDNWRMDISPSQNVRHVITQLKPFTQYAYFVKTMTMTDYHVQIEAYSVIQYFRTLPSKPGPVAKIYYHSLTANEIMLHWWPPRTANGNIGKYIISYEQVDEPSTQTESNKNYMTPDISPSPTDTCRCEEVLPEFSGPTPSDENYFNKEQITYDEALPNLIYVSRLDFDKQTTETTTTETPKVALGSTTNISENGISNQLEDAEKDDDDGNSSHLDEFEANAKRNFHNYRREKDAKALEQQDTGTKDFPIIKPISICSYDNPSMQYQLENKCKPAEHYEGIQLQGDEHMYTLGNLEPEVTYRITIRACVSDLQNGCGCEVAIFAKTVSKRIEIFLKQGLSKFS